MEDGWEDDEISGGVDIDKMLARGKKWREDVGSGILE